MNDIRIIDYENEMKESVLSLFKTIYPDDPFILRKISYDVTFPNHITTKIALKGASIIGQANIFTKSELNGNANLGFHVHPDNRLQGVAKSLSLKAIETAKSKGVSRIYIITQKENHPAIAVAVSIGFCKVNLQYVDKDMVVFLF
jgi:RimJ/RimL family protein N-acetyltransferase